MKSKSNLKEDLKSPWLLGILGTVLVSLIVNGIMIGLSFANPHSLVAKDYYEKGKAYFHARGVQKMHSLKSGYKLKIVTPSQIHVNKNEIIGLSVTDRNGKVYKSSNATLYVYRTNDMTRDFKKILHQSDKGLFQAPVNFPLPGNWDLIAQISVNGEKLDVAQRIFVRK